MRYRTLVPTLIIAFILQLSFMNLISINGIVPNLILCLVLISLLLFNNEHRMIIASVITGFFLDFAVGKFISVYALTYFVLGVVTVVYKQYFNYESKITIIPLCVGGTFIYHVLSSIVLACLGMNISIVKVLTYFAIGSVLNFVVMFIMYVIMIKKATARPKRSRYERYEII